MCNETRCIQSGEDSTPVSVFLFVLWLIWCFLVQEIPTKPDMWEGNPYKEQKRSTVSSHVLSELNYPLSLPRFRLSQYCTECPQIERHAWIEGIHRLCIQDHALVCQAAALMASACCVLPRSAFSTGCRIIGWCEKSLWSRAQIPVEAN